MEIIKKKLSKEVGGAIRSQRLRSEISQSSLAREIETTRATLSKIEKGEALPSVLLLYKICEELHLDLNDILPPVEKFSLFAEGTAKKNEEREKLEAIVNKLLEDLRTMN